MNKRLILGISLFFIGIYPFLLMPYGLDFKDTFYHLTGYTGHRTTHWTGTDIMTFLFPLPGKIWLSFAPNTLISFRIMATVLWISMQIAPIWLIMNSLKANRAAIGALISAGVVIALGVARVPGYDLVAGFWGGLLFGISGVYLHQGGALRLVGMGIVAAAFVGTRLPCVLVMAPITLAVAGKEWEASKRVKTVFARVSILWLTFVGAYFTLYLSLSTNGYNGSVIDSIRAYFEQLLGVNLNNADNRSIRDILNAYIRDGKLILKNLGILIVFVALWRVIAMRFPKFKVILGLMTGLLWYYILKNLAGTPYSWSYVLFANACAWLALSVMGYFSIKKREFPWFWLCFLGFSFGFISALGSGAGLLKMLWSYSYILPIAVWFVWKQVNGPDRLLTGVLTGTLILFGIAEYTYFGSRMEDDRWYRLQSEVNHPMLRGIYTSNTRKEMLEEILEHISDIKAKNPEAKMVYHGRFAWIFRYLDNSKDFYNKNVKMLYSDPEETGLLEAYLEQYPSNSYVVLVYGYPEWMPNADNALVGDLMQQKSYRIYAEGKSYRIFTGAMENR